MEMDGLCQAGLGGYAVDWADGESVWGLRLRRISAHADVGPPDRTQGRDMREICTGLSWKG